MTETHTYTHTLILTSQNFCGKSNRPRKLLVKFPLKPIPLPALHYLLSRTFVIYPLSIDHNKSSPISCTTNTSAAAAAAAPPPSFSLNMSPSSPRHPSLASVAPLQAILFDIDGTLVDSDPIHFHAYREMFLEIGFNDGVPITEEYYAKNLSGMHNEELCHILFPDWDLERARKFLDDKEAMFRRLAAEQLKPVTGLDKLSKWVEDNGLKRAAVTNAPRENAELMITMSGLGKFFELLVIGSECERAKPFPDPYLKALEELGVSSEHAFVFEDSVSGIKAGVAAGMPVVGLATRNPEKLLSEAGATMVIKDYADSQLWTALEDLGKKAGETKVAA